ncbi:MAG: hypothetical protein Q8O76_08230, partial [Chloroflexota bacterium]|nr:hypothetical protein [Chloroflexota bacterium]
MLHPVRCIYVSHAPDDAEGEAIREAWREMRLWLQMKARCRVDFEEVATHRLFQPVTPGTCWALAWELARFPGNHLFIMKGAGAWAGSNVSPQGGGVAVVGD